MAVLHSNKIRDERNAFVDELLKNLPSHERLTLGTAGNRAKRLHKVLLPLYIVKNYTPPNKDLKSLYFDALMSHAIEAECLFLLGFRTSGMATLRMAFESAIKFIYYESHPVENQLHSVGSHRLSNQGYRDFVYSVPQLSTVPFLQKEQLENLWTKLCEFTHTDLRTVALISVVADLKPLSMLTENQVRETVDLVSSVVKVALAAIFFVDCKWLEHVEKVYFDAVLESFLVAERRIIRDSLRVA